MGLAAYNGSLPGPAWLVGVPLNLAPAIGICALLWASALGLGDPIRRGLLRHKDMPDDLPGGGLFLQAAAGMAALLVLFWVLFWAAGVNLATALLPVVLGVGLLITRGVQARRDLSRFDLARQHWPWVLAALMPGLGLLLIASACPPGTLWRVEALGYDVTSYHLQIPKEWIALGRATPLDHNVYSFFPGLMEHAYTAISLISGGSVRDAVYSCQLFHASFALLAVWGLIETARRFTGGIPAIVAGGAVLLVPWVLITGSSAYNEVAALGFGAAAFYLALQPGRAGWRRGVLLGLLLGAATLCKLTAGPMIAVPAVIVALTSGGLAPRKTAQSLPQRFKFVAVVGCAGLLTLAPYFARNTIATGNPVFPFATTVFGAGHWDDALSERWHTAHTLGADRPGTLDALHRQWLGNTGYGALGGTAVPRESHNIARFTRERGLPVFWLAVLTGGALCLGHPRTWRPALAMLGVLLWQLVFWRIGTHLQSRFLLFTLLPAGVLLGVGAGHVRDRAGALRGVLPPIAAAVVLLPLLTVSLTTLWHQTPQVRDPAGGLAPRPILLSIDALAESTRPETLGQPGTHPINLLPPQSKTLVLADNSALLYLDRPVVYNSAFDVNPLGEIVRSTDGSPQAVNDALRARGITHVWVSRSEVRRLSATYGFDPSLTPELLQALTESWRPALDPTLRVPLYRVPPASREADISETAPHP